MKTLLLSMLLVASATVFSQAPGIQWQQSYGGSNTEIFYSIVATSDGGSIMAGETSSNNGDVSGLHGANRDFWVVKINSQGAIQWQKCLGGSSADVATSIRQTSDGGYIVAGSSYSNDGIITGHHGTVNYSDYWVVKLTADGDVQWQKSLGGTSNDEASSIQEMAGGGGYIVAGYSGSYDGDITVHHGVANVHDVWVVRLSTAGQIVWQKTLGGNSADDVSAIKPTPDGGYIMAASSSSNDGDINGQIGLSDWWIIKINGTGSIQWQKRFGGSSQDGARDIQLTADGGYIVAGFTYSADVNVIGNHGGEDMWILKLSNTGALQWQKCLGGSGNDIATSVQVVPGGYAVAGYTESTDGDVTGNHGSRDYWVVKLNGNGDKLWQKAMGGTSEELANSIALLPGGALAIAGSTYSNNGDVSGNHGMIDAWVVKLTSDSAITIKANTGTNICVKTKVTFTATLLNGIQSPAYQWKKNNTNVGTNSATYVDSTLSAGDSVYCILTSTGRVDTSNTLRFTTYTNYQPTIKISGNSSICDGEKTTFTATVTNAAPAYHLQWKKNGTDVGSDSLNYTTTSLQNSDSVWCVVTSITGCATSPVVASSKIKIKTTANVLPTVTIASSPASARFCNNAPAVLATFHASIKNGGGTPFYQWKKNNVNTGTNNAYYSDSVRNGDSIWCVFTSSQKCISANNIVSNKIKITIIAPVTPTVIVVPLPAGATCAGTPVRFKASIKNGGVAPHFQWKKNGVNVGTDSDIFNDSLLQNNDSIWCVLTSNAECVVGNTVVSPKIKQVVNSSVPAKPSAITGPAYVSANQQAITYSVSQVDGVGYAWIVPSSCTLVSGQGTNQVTVNWGSVNATLIVRAKNACGQSDSSRLMVRVTPSFTSVAGNTINSNGLKKSGKDNVQLYPNPANTMAAISFNSANAGKYSMQLLDAQGRILQSRIINAVKGGNTITLSVVPYTQGVYFIKLTCGNKQQETFRLLIQR